MRILLATILAAASSLAHAEDAPFTFWGDFRESLSIATEASYTQLIDPAARNSLLIGGALTFATDRHDRQLFDSLDQNSAFEEGSTLDFIGDEIALFATFTPIVTHYFARKLNDEKLRRFSIETFSAMTLVYTETLILSQFGFHQRPRVQAGDEPSGFFDTGIRGQSSFPSGHVLAPTILTLKTFDAYGWKPALIPAALTTATTLQRISNGSHFPSDLVGSFALGIAAHLATKRVYQDRHPDELRLGLASTGDGGLMLTGRFRF